MSESGGILSSKIEKKKQKKKQQFLNLEFYEC